jgi:hypothetical protein
VKRRPQLTAAELRFLIEALSPFRTDRKGHWDRISNKWVWSEQLCDKLTRMVPEPTQKQKRRLKLEEEALARFNSKRFMTARAVDAE